MKVIFCLSLRVNCGHRSKCKNQIATGDHLQMIKKTNEQKGIQSMTKNLRHNLPVSLLMLLALFVSFHALSKPIPLPEAELIEFKSGEKLNTKDFKGKVLYLDFWASWCIPCKKSFPFMNDLLTRYDSEKFQVVAVNMDAFREDADEFLKKIPANFPVYENPRETLAQQLDLPGLPVAYIVSAEGKIVAKHTGFNDEKKAKKIKQLDYLLGQK